MCIDIQQITYIHPDKEVFFSNISFSVMQGQKIALIGNNGSGKSTLLQLINGDIPISSGEIIRKTKPYYVPQHFGQYNDLSITGALQIDHKLLALRAILQGDASADNFNVLDDDWGLEERAVAALDMWGVGYLNLDGQIKDLSGGEKTKIFLAGITIHNPAVILLDEPTNHLDFESRKKLYDYIQTSHTTMIVVSHDRTLLNLLTSMYELGRDSITYYAGNYDFYKNQKELELESLQSKLDDKEKELRKARKIARETAERKQKHEVRGKKNNIKKGVGKMAMDTLQDKAEKSSSKLKDIHSDKMESIVGDIANIRTALPDVKLMKTDFNTSSLHAGKILITAKDINYSYGSRPLWKDSLNFQIRSGDRVVIKGINGSGKTTLIKLLTGISEPVNGILERADFKYVFLDQEYSVINDDLTVFEQIQTYNSELHDSELKTILNRFLFPYDMWDKLCRKLSGGEKMKLTLCCLMVSTNTPDMFILDEPTNNIDIQNIDILTNTIKDYKGTVLVVSHDEYFINEIGIDYSIQL